MDEFDLRGRLALITGAARGIGRACAEILHERGATVVSCDRVPGDGYPAATRIERREEAVLDVRDSAAVDEWVKGVLDRHGRVDILVNNAGGSFAAGFLDTSSKGEASLVAENFTQITHLIRMVVPHMPSGSAIVNVTSVEAFQAAPGFAVYAAMKAALQSLTRSLALELAPRGIRVNAVAPDALSSGGEERARAAFLESGVPFDPAVVPPLGRFGTPADAAGAVLFLVSTLADFVTGTTIHVDGGSWAAGGWRLRDVPGPGDDVGDQPPS